MKKKRKKREKKEIKKKKKDKKTPLRYLTAITFSKRGKERKPLCPGKNSG